MVKTGKAVKRQYQSPLREGQATTTRTAVIDSAGQLFAERGYAATSIEEIARAAGVSRATVFTSVGGKPVLLKTAFDVAIVGDDEAVSLTNRPRSRLIRAEPDPRKYLSLYAELVTEMGGRLAPIAEAVRGAAGADADARSLWEAHLAQRRQGAANVVSDLLAKGARLRRHLDAAAAADLLWVLNDPGLYGHLVLRRGWTPSRFRIWLEDSMKRQLLSD
ncbi:MAG TPA: helix-turn-helix domain-containing protein [Candidatus Dormibacteraeota bacterium]|nr:helix-turn-helix domain-containing protein [Candidatus Dormibacteraeota bacterium]